MPSNPKLRIFAGPNGSGKTTLFESISSTYFSTKLFINADFLERDFGVYKFTDLSNFDLQTKDSDFQNFCRSHGLYKKAKFTESSWNLAISENVIVGSDRSLKMLYNSYHFALIADFIRYKLLGLRSSFSFESVFSHSSKLDLIDEAKRQRYKTYLYFIGTETPIMNIERVNDRIMKGGHAVDDNKIISRYYLTMELLFDVIKKVDEAYFWDNSGSKHKYIGSLKKGSIEFQQSVIPDWFYKYVLDKAH